jgi:hypothetical protein
MGLEVHITKYFSISFFKKIKKFENNKTNFIAKLNIPSFVEKTKD